jgi:hypothetical protein
LFLKHLAVLLVNANVLQIFGYPVWSPLSDLCFGEHAGFFIVCLVPIDVRYPSLQIPPHSIPTFLNRIVRQKQAVPRRAEICDVLFDNA